MHADRWRWFQMPHALRFSNVIRNASPTKANNGMTPLEKQAGKKLPISDCSKGLSSASFLRTSTKYSVSSTLPAAWLVSIWVTIQTTTPT